MNLINLVLFLFSIVLEKPVSHEAYSTGQCRDFAEPAARQIPSESSLPPGKHVHVHVATTLALFSGVTLNISMEWSRRRCYSQK